MKKQDLIDEIQSQIEKQRITVIDELEEICKKDNLEPYDDILGPMGWNVCDRCGRLEDSEYGLFWFDYFDWTDSLEDRAIQLASEKEKVDYCATCWDCIKELKMKGKVLLKKEEK